jgi:hypothetical protein
MHHLMILLAVLLQAPTPLPPELPADLAPIASQLDAAMHVAGYQHPLADTTSGVSVAEFLPRDLHSATSTSVRLSILPDSPERRAELARLQSTPDGWRCYVARGIYAAIGAWGRYLRTHGREPEYVQIALAPLYQEIRQRARACWDDHGQGPGSSRGAMDAERAWSGKRLGAFESLWQRDGVTARVQCIAMDGAAGSCAPGVSRLTPGEALVLAAAVVVGLVPESAPISWPALAQRLAAAGVTP